MFQTEGEYRAVASDSMRKLMCFMSVKACKPVIMNLKVSTSHFLYIKIHEPSIYFFSDGIYITLACYEI